MGFEAPDYSIVEGEGVVLVCATLTGRLEIPISVVFSVRDPPGRNQGTITAITVVTALQNQGWVEILVFRHQLERWPGGGCTVQTADSRQQLLHWIQSKSSPPCR